MGCEEVRIEVPLLLAEELGRHERQKVLEHLKGCGGCRDEFEALTRTWALMERWTVDEPSPDVKSRVMAAAREELEEAALPWWARLCRSFSVPTLVGALALSAIVYLVFPYDRVIALCETNIAGGGWLAFFPRILTYFVLGMLYGLVPLSISALYFSKRAADNPASKGLVAGFGYAAFLIPFFILRCPEFASGLVVTMVFGIMAGSLSGGVGSLLISTKARERMA